MKNKFCKYLNPYSKLIPVTGEEKNKVVVNNTPGQMMQREMTKIDSMVGGCRSFDDNQEFLSVHTMVNRIIVNIK